MAHSMLQRVPPRILADRGELIESKGKIEDFGRLAEIVEADLRGLDRVRIPQEWRQAPVDIRLRFGWTEASPGIPALEGRVSAVMTGICQRCLEPFEFVLDADLKLLLPEPGGPVRSVEGYEVWEFAEANFRPIDVVEEALIMAMPFSALHESLENCGVSAGYGETYDNESVKPFADLRSLMASAEDEN